MDFLERLRSPGDLLAVELRPPRADLDAGASMDSWFAMNAAVRRAATPGRVVFLTDSAVGSPEEENLHHLVTNLEDGVPRDLICPFLTTKHDLEYCLWFAARAVEARFPALVVLGGDPHVGPPRCLPHGHLLRQRIRERFPSLALGGWANPHDDADRQVGYLLREDIAADFYLTQVVSHHDLAPVERFLRAAERARVPLPGVFGVFYYRSPNPRTLEFLSRFFPVPAAALTREFAEGRTPDEICAATIRALRAVGATRIYVSNLDTNRAGERLAAVEALLA